MYFPGNVFPNSAAIGEFAVAAKPRPGLGRAQGGGRGRPGALKSLKSLESLGVFVSETLYRCIYVYMYILEWTRALNAREASWHWVKCSWASRFRKTFCQFADACNVE